MSEPDIDTPDPDEVDADDLDLFLTSAARVTVTAGNQWTYRGTSHWPKVEISDGPLIIENEDGTHDFEDGESLIYRVTELTLRTAAALTARMRIEIDERLAQDQAARTAPPTQPAG